MKKSVYVVYDSGVGGLTVLAEMIKQQVNSKLIYIGDTINAPYGNKTAEQIIGYIQKNLIEVQEKYQIKAVIMACNTASILAKRGLEELFDFPIYSISESILEDTRYTEGVCYLTTMATQKSDFFKNEIKKDVVLGCKSFVPLIEGGNYYFEEERKETVKRELERLRQKSCNQIVLACTHFPFLKKEIEEYVKYAIPVYDPSESFVAKIKDKIETSELSVEFKITGNQEDFKLFLKERMHVEQEEPAQVEVSETQKIS